MFEHILFKLSRISLNKKLTNVFFGILYWNYDLINGPSLNQSNFTGPEVSPSFAKALSKMLMICFPLRFGVFRMDRNASCTIAFLKYFCERSFLAKFPSFCGLSKIQKYFVTYEYSSARPIRIIYWYTKHDQHPNPQWHMIFHRIDATQFRWIEILRTISTLCLWK